MHSQGPFKPIKIISRIIMMTSCLELSRSAYKLMSYTYQVTQPISVSQLLSNDDDVTKTLHATSRFDSNTKQCSPSSYNSRIDTSDSALQRQSTIPYGSQGIVLYPVRMKQPLLSIGAELYDHHVLFLVNINQIFA